MRVDVYLAAAGYVPSRKKAQDLIKEEAVRIDGKTVRKASETVNESVEHNVVIEQVFKYVSRGGMKLEAALDAFSVNVNGKKVVDVGASTGGFTDCLLCRGAKKVYAVDAGIGQLHEKLRSDSRVVCIERFNARELTSEITEGKCDAAVADVSFISQTYILPRIPAVLVENGLLISLIKPQFEAGRGALNKQGVVRHVKDRIFAVSRVLEAASAVGLTPLKLAPSPILGGDGNEEFLALFRRDASANITIDIEKTVKEGAVTGSK